MASFCKVVQKAVIVLALASGAKFLGTIIQNPVEVPPDTAISDPYQAKKGQRAGGNTRNGKTGWNSTLMKFNEQFTKQLRFVSCC
jgi:hypothetical protein